MHKAVFSYNLLMDSINDEISSYICADVETAGPIPGQYALLSIGACTLEHPRRTFYIELQPDKDLTDPQAMAVHHLDMHVLARDGLNPRAALLSFAAWVSSVVPAGQSPVFVAFNAPFDWMFIHDYFMRYLGENPFGHSALDIKAFYMGASRKPWSKTSGKYLHKLYNHNKALTHNALQDAIDQAVIFENLLAELNEH